MADRRSNSGDLLGFIGNDKTWYKKCFLGAVGAQHARSRPGLQEQSLYSLHTYTVHNHPLFSSCTLHTHRFLPAAFPLLLQSSVEPFWTWTPALVYGNKPPMHAVLQQHSQGTTRRLHANLDHVFVELDAFHLKTLQALHQSITTVLQSDCHTSVKQPGVANWACRCVTTIEILGDM